MVSKMKIKKRTVTPDGDVELHIEKTTTEGVGATITYVPKSIIDAWNLATTADEKLNVIAKLLGIKA